MNELDLKTKIEGLEKAIKEHDDMSVAYKNNLNTIIDFNNNFTIKGTNDSTYYKIFTKSFSSSNVIIPFSFQNSPILGAPQ